MWRYEGARGRTCEWARALGCDGTIAGAIGFAGAVGRADSTVGQSTIAVPDIDVVSWSGSAVWQCDALSVVSVCAGARQSASHHARSGAAVARTTAVRINSARFNTSLVYCFFCAASRSLERSPDRILLIA